MLSAKTRAKIRRALRAGQKPLEVARRLHVSLLTVSHVIAGVHPSHHLRHASR